MYICICKGISEQDIAEASKTSGSTKEALKSLGVATDCGRCWRAALEKYAELASDTPRAAKNSNPRPGQN